MVREELAKVTVTLKGGNTIQAKPNESVKLNAGEVITHINGVPVAQVSNGSGSTGGGSSGGTSAYASAVVQQSYSTPMYAATTVTTPSSTQVLVQPRVTYQATPVIRETTVTPYRGWLGKLV